MTPEEFLRERQMVEDLKREAATAQGRLQQLLQRAADDFDCETLKELRAEVSRREKILDKLEAALGKERKAWYEEFHDELGDPVG